MNRPIDGVDLDGLEYMSVNSSMYRFKSVTTIVSNENSVKKQVYNESLVAVVFENIPDALRDFERRDFKFVSGFVVTGKGRDWDAKVDGPILTPEGRYNYKTPAFWGNIASKNISNDGMAAGPTSGLYHFRMGPEANDINAGAEGRMESIGAAPEHVVGMAGNWSNRQVWIGLGNESLNRKQFYAATNIVDSYLSKGRIKDGSITDYSSRGELINFLTDGFLISDNSTLSSLSLNVLEHTLKIAYAGIQLIYQNNIDLQSEMSEKFKSLNQEYKSRGGKLNFDAIYDLKRPEQ